VAGKMCVIRIFVTCKEGEMMAACSARGRYDKCCRVFEEKPEVKERRGI